MATVAVRRLFGNSLRIRSQVISSMNYSSGGKDSGSSGAIRESGGAFGKKEKAEEDRYFRKLQKDQLKNLKSELHSEIKHHEEQIKHHEEALKRHKKRLSEVKDD